MVITRGRFRRVYRAGLQPRRRSMLSITVCYRVQSILDAGAAVPNVEVNPAAPVR
jgi:hypothetical protein